MAQSAERMIPPVLKRQQRADAARVLLALHAKGNLDAPSSWTWDTVDKLPAWCLNSAEDRVRLQLICGVMYLSPDIRLWISKAALIAVQELIGDEVFERILREADALRLPKDEAAQIIADFGLDPATATLHDLRTMLMAAGSSVLSATVHESLPVDMLTASLGPAIGEITERSATVFLQAAQSLATLDTRTSF